MKNRMLFCGLMALICLAGLTGCQPEVNDTPNASPDVTQEDAEATVKPVTDLNVSEPKTYEALLPLEFSEGEEVDNPYYRRAADENGVPSYMVRTEDGELYLPMNDTVVYPGGEAAYYETVEQSFKLDGEPVVVLQYQLHAPTTAISD